MLEAVSAVRAAASGGWQLPLESALATGIPLRCLGPAAPKVKLVNALPPLGGVAALGGVVSNFFKGDSSGFGSSGRLKRPDARFWPIVSGKEEPFDAAASNEVGRP